MPVKKVNMTKVSNANVNKMKGRLLEVRRIGAKPIFIQVNTRTSIKDALKNVDIPSANVKVEGLVGDSTTWEVLTLKSKAIKYSKIAVTTKVAGA